MNNNNFGNIILVIVLVLLVGFGVWYFTMNEGPADDGGGIRVELEGGNGDGN